MLKIVLTGGIPAAALRSGGGASNALLRQIAYRRIALLVTAPLLAEYETELKQAEQRLAHGRLIEAIDRFLSAIASVSELVVNSYQWRPRLGDPVDEMVLEAAAIGAADVIVAHDPQRFAAASRFGLRVRTPGQLLKEI